MTFEQIDLQDFRRVSFEEMRDFCEKSCKDMDGIENLWGRFELLGETAFACTIAGGLTQTESNSMHITVWCGKGGCSGDICWAITEMAVGMAVHGGFAVDADDHGELMKGCFSFSRDEKHAWTAGNAAKYLWEEFIALARTSL